MTQERPGPGQQSVWDYPRPPRVESEPRQVRIVFGGITIATSTSALRVLETSHPPGIYVPMSDLVEGVLVPAPGTSYCEWKGVAGYFDVVTTAATAVAAAWYYPEPTPGYEMIADHVSVYPARMEACFLGDELVTPQGGDFYGGWITSDVVGPFKGGPGTRGW